MQPKITAMLIMGRETRLPLLEVLESCDTIVLPVCDCTEARRMLEAHPQVQVVVTGTTLPDGDWRDVLAIVAQGHGTAEVVVCSPLGGRTLWQDALEHGVYDLLIEPYLAEEIRRTIQGAAALSYMRSLPPARAGNHTGKATVCRIGA